MITSQNLFRISYYEKAHFTGSQDGMRFLIEKIILDEIPYLRAWIFPGPFCFEKTDDSQKKYKDFAFSNDALSEIADWLNQQYEADPDTWHKHKQIYSS